MLLAHDTGNAQSLFYSFSTNVTYIVGNGYLFIVLLCAGHRPRIKKTGGWATSLFTTRYDFNRPANLMAVNGLTTNAGITNRHCHGLTLSLNNPNAK